LDGNSGADMMVVGQMGEGGSGKMELGLSASLSFEVWVDFATWVFLMSVDWYLVAADH